LSKLVAYFSPIFERITSVYVEMSSEKDIERVFQNLKAFETQSSLQCKIHRLHSEALVEPLSES